MTVEPHDVVNELSSRVDNMYFASISEGLSKLCELRSIDLSSCDVWLCDKDTGATASAINLSRDTGSLVGRHLKITGEFADNPRA